jgi:hypothetical protein
MLPIESASRASLFDGLAGEGRQQGVRTRAPCWMSHLTNGYRDADTSIPRPLSAAARVSHRAQPERLPLMRQ